MGPGQGDERTPDDRYDVTRTIVHELAHGLGSISSDVETDQGLDYGQGEDRALYVFDHFVVDGAGARILGNPAFPPLTDELVAQLTGDDLSWSRPVATAANGGRRPALHAPDPYLLGTSVSHLDEDAYPEDTRDSMMSPADVAGEWSRSPGPVALGMLTDIGWSLAVVPER